jgi:asparagine synthetase B (glutamine-hydrolysing)
MTVDSEAIFALAEEFDGIDALEQLRGSMATAWIDERRPELFVARGAGRPLFLGRGRHEAFFASTTLALELLEDYLGLELDIDEVPEGCRLMLEPEGDIDLELFRPDRHYEETPLPAVRAPHEGDHCLRILPGLI